MVERLLLGVSERGVRLGHGVHRVVLAKHRLARVRLALGLRSGLALLRYSLSTACRRAARSFPHRSATSAALAASWRASLRAMTSCSFLRSKATRSEWVAARKPASQWCGLCQ